jgi:hypothetical protein
MNRAIVDDALRSQLGEIHSRTELCSKDGRVLGVFLPVEEQERRRYERARAGYSPDEIKELEQRSQDRRGLTTDQVMRRLREMNAG